MGENVKEMSADGFTPLLLAVRGGHTETCELLLSNGSDLEEKVLVTKRSALHLASADGHSSLLQLLIDHRGDVNSRDITGGTPLHFASQEGHLSCVAMLLQAGADPLMPDKTGALSIHHSASLNHHRVVHFFIEQGRCSPNQVKDTPPVNRA